MISMLVSRNVELYDQWGAPAPSACAAGRGRPDFFAAAASFRSIACWGKNAMSRPFRIALVVTCALVLLYLILRS